MQYFLLIDPATGRGIGSSETTVPNYEPHDNEISCTAEQYDNPGRWVLTGTTLVQVDPIAQGPIGPVITYKADLWRRCSDDEAAKVDAALKSAPVRQRRLFEDAAYLDHSDEAFAFAFKALVDLFGEPRANELLATS